MQGRLGSARLGSARPGPVATPPTPHPPPPHLGDFSQSRLANQLSNGGREGESSTFPPRSAAPPQQQQINQPSINIPVKWLQVGPTPVALIQSSALPPHSPSPSRRRRCRVNFSAGGSRCPLRASPQQQEGDGEGGQWEGLLIAFREVRDKKTACNRHRGNAGYYTWSLPWAGWL